MEDRLQEVRGTVQDATWPGDGTREDLHIADSVTGITGVSGVQILRIAFPVLALNGGTAE